MNKERKVIEPNAIIVFDRDVNSSELVKLPEDFKGEIVINGSLVCDRKLSIQCGNLYANRVYSDEPSINIIGNLYTSGNVDVHDITVNGSIYSKGDIDVGAIKVNGSIYCKGDLNSEDVTVAEDLEVECEIEGNHWNSYVGGNFICKGSIENIDCLRVLGKYKVDGTLYNVTDICIG